MKSTKAHSVRTAWFMMATMFMAATLVAGCLKQDSNTAASAPKKMEAAKSGPVVVTFGNESLTQGEIVQKIQTLPAQLRTFVLKNKKQFVEDMVAEQLLVKEAQSRGLESAPEVQSLIEAARKKILTAKLIEQDVDKKINVTADDVQKYYNEHKSDFVSPVLLRASHILVKTEDEAKAIKTQLSQGADFEELARSKSIDNTAVRGGDLEFFQKGQFVPEFEAVAFTMKKGQISDVVKTKFGFHIIKLTDRIESSPRDFNSVKAAIESKLRTDRRSAAIKQLVDKAKASVKISIDDKVLDGIAVSAPTAATATVKK